MIFIYFFTVIKSDSLMRIYIYVRQDPAKKSNSQNAGKKRNPDPRRGMETEIHKLPVDSSRSLEYQYEYLSVTYCQHRRYAGASPRALFPLQHSSVPPPPPGELALIPYISLHLPPPRSLANCHFTDSLFCENRLHSDSNEASFTPCHASYTP